MVAWHLRRRRLARLAMAVSIAWAGCRRPQPALPAPTPAAVHAFPQFAIGDTLELVRIQLGLDNCEVRYRGGVPAGELSAVYFMPTGNLHADARRIGDTWVLISRPLLDPSPLPAADRVAAWDAAADPQHIKTRSDR